ncbi:MAG: HDIG domain-containing metalloprotein [Elusimicrobiota bacterium]
MPITSSKEIKENKKNRFLNLVNVLLIVLILGAVITYSGANIGTLVGFMLIIAGMFFMEFMFFIKYHPHTFDDPSKVILIKIVIIIMLLMVFLIKASDGLSGYLFPIGAAAILLTILTSSFSAAINVFVIAVIAGMMEGFSMGHFLVAVFGGMAGVYSAQEIRNRKDLNKCGLVILAANILTIVAVGLVEKNGILQMGVNIVAGAGNALISVIIASGMLPIFEGMFGITTNIRLLEIGDFNNPLLKRLMLEAPGTYHHSLMVGNLAENACERIGANSLLARIGAYYHDAGKLKNPHYFIENQMHAGDKHKNLKPNISTLILKRHIKDGLALAEEYKLDKVLKDIIEQHHGNTLIEYFYKKVLEENKENNDVDEKEFRYPGPRPETKETGVLMLADSVEAACRTLAEPTFSRISNLVRKIITNKFIDLQLNNCDLTLANLEEIQKSFTNTLASIYHSRIEYPEDTEENSIE